MNVDICKQLLKDIVLCYVYRDNKMFRRRLKKANDYIYINKNINNKYINNINNINHLLYHTTELKKKLEELVKELKLEKTARYRSGICSECGKEGSEITKSGMCLTCDTKKRQKKCNVCGKWRRIKARGMCNKCYHRRERVVDGTKDE